MIGVPSILVGLLAHTGLDVDDVAHPLDLAFARGGKVVRDFRSAAHTKSTAGRMKSSAEKIVFPDALPYIAGVWTDRIISLTGIQFADNIAWYSGKADATIVVGHLDLPETLLTALRGRRIGEIIDHPGLAACDDTVLGATRQDGHVTLRTTLIRLGVERRANASKPPAASMRA